MLIYYLESVFLTVFELFCCKIFFEAFAEYRNKKNKKLRFFQFLLFVVLDVSIVFLLAEYLIIKLIVVILLFSLFMYWYMDISFRKSLLLEILFSALNLLAEFIVVFLLTALFSDGAVLQDPYDYGKYLLVLIGKAILFLMVILVRKFFGKKRMEMVSAPEWMGLLVFPIFTILASTAIIYSFGLIASRSQASILFVLAIILSGMNIVEYYLIHGITEREAQLRESKLFELEARCQTEMYHAISEGYDRQKRKTHEYKNQMLCIDSLLAKKQYEELRSYVRGICGELNNEPDIINANHVIINAVLNSKYQEMQEKGIVFVFRINDLSGIPLSDEDAVTLLANLLDNAIEACMQCAEKKVIQFKLLIEDGKVILSVKNTYAHKLLREEGEYKTTKVKDSEEHGMGMKNIIRILESYGGSYVIRELDSEFLFSIIIPLNNQK